MISSSYAQPRPQSTIEIDPSSGDSHNCDDVDEALQKNILLKIVKKYRSQQYVSSFISKLRRNNVHRIPAHFELQTELQPSGWSIFRLKGVDFKYKSLQSFIFAGDIIFILIIFVTSVFQAFLQHSRQQMASSTTIFTLKVAAILFELSKLTIISIKKDMLNGKMLIYVTDIIWHSIGIFQLLLYLSSIASIVLAILLPQSETVGYLAFVIVTVRLFKIPISLKILDLHYINSQRKQAYWNLGKVIIFQMLFGHFIAGLLLAMVKIDEENNWLTARNLESASWNSQYYWAIYWAATLITSTGFGDFVATNRYEAVMVAVLELFSSVVLVCNINIIGSIVMNLRRSDQNIQKKHGIFRRMVEEYPIPPNIEQKIHSFLEQENEIAQKFQFEQRKNLLNFLPQQLKDQYNNDVNQTIFQELPFFRHLRLETLGNLANHFTCRVCYPGEQLTIHKRHNDSILILRSGQVNFKYRVNGATFMNGSIVESIKTIKKKNALIASPVLLSNKFISRNREANFDIVAAQYSLIMGLSSDAFMEIIRKSEIEKQHFFTIYDKHDNSDVFDCNECCYCDGDFHNKFECPKLHYIPYKSLVAQKFLTEGDKPQFRIRFQKLNKRKEHCYYLRKEYFRIYEGQNNINCKSIGNQIVNRLYKMKSFVDQFDESNMLLKFQTMFRRIRAEKKEDNLEKQGILQIDVAHNYLSYFTESNPKQLVDKYLKVHVRRARKLTHKLTLLSNNSKKNLYRKPDFSQSSSNQYDMITVY